MSKISLRSESSVKIPWSDLQFTESTDDNESIDQISEGGFSKVYRGEWRVSSNDDNNTNNIVMLPVAVKVMHISQPTVRKRFIKEVTALAINSTRKNAVRLYGGGEDDLAEKCWIVMELMNEGNLDQFCVKSITNPRPHILGLSWPRKWHLVRSTVEAVHNLHQYQIMHRDIKRSNFLIRKIEGEEKNNTVEGKEESNEMKRSDEIRREDRSVCEAVICDLGCCEAIWTPTATTNKQKEFIHTAIYSAPEWLETDGQNSYTPAMDIFSLGIAFWEVFFNEKVYGGRPFGMIESGIILGQIRPPLKNIHQFVPEPYTLNEFPKVWNIFDFSARGNIVPIACHNCS